MAISMARKIKKSISSQDGPESVACSFRSLTGSVTFQCTAACFVRVVEYGGTCIENDFAAEA